MKDSKPRRNLATQKPPTPDFAAEPLKGWSDADVAKHFKTLLFRERRRHATCESVFARTVRDQDKTIAALRQELFVLLAVVPKPKGRGL
jgi:hypothetical protein